MGRGGISGGTAFPLPVESGQVISLGKYSPLSHIKMMCKDIQMNQTSSKLEVGDRDCASGIITGDKGSLDMGWPLLSPHKGRGRSTTVARRELWSGKPNSTTTITRCIMESKR